MRLRLKFRSRPNSDYEVVCGDNAGVSDSMLLIRSDEPDRTGFQQKFLVFHREFNRAFADQPHFRVRMMMRGWSWRASRRQHRLVNFQALTSSKFSMKHEPHLCAVVGHVHGRILETERA